MIIIDSLLAKMVNLLAETIKCNSKQSLPRSTSIVFVPIIHIIILKKDNFLIEINVKKNDLPQQKNRECLNGESYTLCWLVLVCQSL